MSDPAAASAAGATAAIRPAPGLIVGVALLLAAFVTLCNLAHAPLHDWDEAWHAIVALEMVRSGAWVAYTEDGELTTAAHKPPLYLWLMAASFRLLGPTTFAARLLPALCHIATVGVVTAWLHRRTNWTVALTAGFLLATHPLLVFEHGARAGEIEPLLVFTLTLTMLGVCRLRQRGGCWWLPLVWAAAVLTKGAAALQIVPAILLWLVLERAWRALPRALGALVAGLVPFVAFLVWREQYQPGVLAGALGEDLFGRLTTRLYDAPHQPWFFYVAALGRRSLPLIIALGVVLVAVRGRPALATQLRQPEERTSLLRLLLCWWLVPLVLFSAAATKHTWYAHPSLVPALILAAWLLRAGLTRAALRRRPLLRAVIGAVVAMGLGLPASVRAVYPQPGDTRRRQELTQLVTLARRHIADQPIYAYRAAPAERFVLKRARLETQWLVELAHVRGTLSQDQATLLLAPRSVAAELRRIEARVNVHPLLDMPKRGYQLLEIRAAR